MQPSPRKRKQPDSLDGPAVGTRGRHTKTESEDYEEFAAKAAAAEAAAMMANLRRSQEQARLHAQQAAAAEAAAAAAASAVTAAQQPPPPPLQQRELERRRSCCCKKSHCLKLYCECFAGGDMCDEDSCRCTNCRNTVRFDRERLAAVEAAQEKNKDACRPKTAQSVKQHNKGCQCKKSSCLKRYCECFQANIKCSDQCRCTDCRNGSDADDGASTSSGGGSSQATVDASLPSSQASNVRKRGRPRRTASSTDVQERKDAWPLRPQRAHVVLPGFNEFQPDFEAARNTGNGFGAQYAAPVSAAQQRTTGGFITDDMLKGLCDTLLAAAAQAGSPATPYGIGGGGAMHIAQSATATIRQPSWGLPTPGEAEPRDPKRPISPDTAQLLCSENEAEEEDKCGRWEWARSGGGGSGGGGSSGRGGSGGGGGRVVVQKCSVELYSFPDRTMTARP